MSNELISIHAVEKLQCNNNNNKAPHTFGNRSKRFEISDRSHLRPFPLSPGSKLLKLLANLTQLGQSLGLAIAQGAQVLLLQLLEVLVELLVPGVEDEDLERQRGGGDHEVREGEATCQSRHRVVCIVRLGLFVYLLSFGLTVISVFSKAIFSCRRDRHPSVSLRCRTRAPTWR